MRSVWRCSAVVGALLAVAGCREPPSWAVRWRIADRENPGADPEALESAEQCSRVGLSVLELTTVASDVIAVERRDKPCWAGAMKDPNRTLGGPALPPGEYDLVVRGLRTSNEPWCIDACNLVNLRADLSVCPADRQLPPLECDGLGVLQGQPEDDVEGLRASVQEGCYGPCIPAEECELCDAIERDTELYGYVRLYPGCFEGGCHPSFLACDCVTFTAVDGETVHIRDLVIDPPPECLDGIDSDGDGLVDERDPGCQSGKREDIDVITTQLLVDFSLLSSNPAATCSGVGLSRFDISLDGRVVASPACDIGQVGVNLEVGAGPHEVGVVGLAFDGTPLTRQLVFPVEALEVGVIEPQLLEVDFADTDFLEPIRSEAQFAVGFATPEGLPTRYCPGAPGLLDIEEVAIRIVDAVGDPVQPAVVIQHGQDPLPGMRLDGSPLPCTSQAIITEPLRWGVYQVEVEAFSAEGDVCFSNVGEPALLAPGAGISVVAPRVEPVPASCRECTNDGHCPPGARCEDGICVL